MKKLLSVIHGWFTRRLRPLAPSTVTEVTVYGQPNRAISTTFPLAPLSVYYPAPVAPPATPAPIPALIPTPAPMPSPVAPVALPLGTLEPVKPPTPTFYEDFSSGALDTSKWIPSNENAPGGGVFRPLNVACLGVYSLNENTKGCLRITVSQEQNPDGSTSSIGGELQSKQKFGFGTYEFVFRASSTSDTPDGPGKAVSGQISSGFIFQQDNGYTEIDCPEIEGQHPDTISWTSWVDNQTRENTNTSTPNPEATFHSYKMVWTPTEIDFYVDGIFVARNSVHVPQNPAYIMINHWGTNSLGWGGLATPGVSRYMFVKSVSFTPLT